MDPQPRLIRSLTDRVLAGVGGGLAAYTGLNALWFRLIFLVVILTTQGFGVLLYVILWLVLPPETLEDLPHRTPGAGQLAALGLATIGVGVGFLVVLHTEASGTLLWPVAVLALGGALLWRQRRGV